MKYSAILLTYASKKFSLLLEHCWQNSKVEKMLHGLYHS